MTLPVNKHLAAIRSELDQLAQRPCKKLTVRKLLDLYGYQQRGTQIDEEIREHLSALQLTTSPDFADRRVEIDDDLEIVLEENAEKQTRPQTMAEEIAAKVCDLIAERLRGTEGMTGIAGRE